MILQSFEIENWSCIQRLSVEDLPATGVVVVHGPNGTGKSSIVEALRACLMDNKSTSKALDRAFPKNSNAKPRVSVTFRAAEAVWKITKQFNSKDCKLEMQMANGNWRLETTDPSEAHDRTRRLTGGTDSNLGLHQLLWLTQAEFHLPDPKKFDDDVQSRLRTILGVLQTALDDRFISRVKKEWSQWFSIRSKPGEKPKLKKDCALDKAQRELQKGKAELGQIEGNFQNYENMMLIAEGREVLMRDLKRQLAEKIAACAGLQEEYERSLKRLEAHQHAADRLVQAEKALDKARALGEQRTEADQHLHEAERIASAVNCEVEEKGRQLDAAELRLREYRNENQTQVDAGRALQAHLNAVNQRRRLLSLKEQVRAARDNLNRAEQSAGDLDHLKKQAREHPAPDPAKLKELQENRDHAAQLRAELEAAAITLALLPDPGAASPQLVIDGAPSVQGACPTASTPLLYSIRRRAEIVIPGWGRANLTRGSDARTLDQIETALGELDCRFAEESAVFGVAARDPLALDHLRNLAADQKARDPELKRLAQDLGRLAPEGLDQLRQQVAALDSSLLASATADDPLAPSWTLPSDGGALDRLAVQLGTQIKDNEDANSALQEEIDLLVRKTDGVGTVVTTGFLEGKKISQPHQQTAGAPGLRQQLTGAKEQLAASNAMAEARRNELKRLLSAEQIQQEIGEAEQALCEARRHFDLAKLSESEQSIHDRLENAKEGVRVLQAQLVNVEREFHQIEGAMTQAEGLHQKRAAAAARVEELCRQTEREALQSEAFDRLYALFEECRERQLGTLMGPIHDRVLRWMRLLRIGGYQSIRFNDHFLPDMLVAGDGATELALREESTGTIEQIGLMVRLALGSTLSTPEEPVVAILDDPLTHSDVVRLDRMRAVLKSAAAGDPDSIPPAGPLQIVVLTCHPEWFIMDGAKVIDLSNSDVLSKTY